MSVDDETDKIEECDAWFQYLEATRGLPTKAYEKVEPHAWRRLRARLLVLKKRKQRRLAA